MQQNKIVVLSTSLAALFLVGVSTVHAENAARPGGECRVSRSGARTLPGRQAPSTGHACDDKSAAQGCSQAACPLLRERTLFTKMKR
jgi:hypothetical protein